MKPATISLASIAGTLGVVAAIGFAQPDGLQPPAGPVDDTQPSLASISQQIADCAASSGFPPNLQVLDVSIGVNGNPVTVLDGVQGVRLYSVSFTGSTCRVTDGNGRSIIRLAGNAWRPDINSVVGSQQVLLGGVAVDTPIQIESENSQSVTAHLYYWVEGDNQ